MGGHGGCTPLWEDVPVSEMQRLRNEGYTNREIAKHLGCSTRTIYKYLGKMPSELFLKSKNKKGPEEIVDTAAPSEETPVTICNAIGTYETAYHPVLNIKKVSKQEVAKTLKVVKEFKIVDLEGVLCKYRVDTMLDSVEFKDGVVSGVLDSESISEFINELVEIREMMKGGGHT